MVYRQANSNDYDALTELRIAYFRTRNEHLTNEQLTVIRKKLPLYYNEHLNRDLFVYVAEENKQLIATAYLLIVEKPASPSFLTGKIGEVLSVFTEEKYRRKGISSCLMRSLLEDAQGRELSFVELEATEDGYPVYKKIGFSEVKEQEYTPMQYKMGGAV